MNAYYLSIWLPYHRVSRWEWEGDEGQTDVERTEGGQNAEETRSKEDTRLQSALEIGTGYVRFRPSMLGFIIFKPVGGLVCLNSKLLMIHTIENMIDLCFCKVCPLGVLT